MADWTKIFALIPEVRKPDEKKLAFNVKLKWTLIILIAFFILANISLFGLSNNALERFEYLAIILGTDFGSIISLGIGPIVMASIILQLLTGAGIININTNTAEGKKFFQGIQKLLVLFFIIFESLVYVLMKGFEKIGEEHGKKNYYLLTASITFIIFYVGVIIWNIYVIFM